MGYNGIMENDTETSMYGVGTGPLLYVQLKYASAGSGRVLDWDCCGSGPRSRGLLLGVSWLPFAFP